MYRTDKTFEWNYDHAPSESPPPNLGLFEGGWTYGGLNVHSPFALAAGPGLNADWLFYYTNLGFDILTYKTVRTHEHGCNPMPNVVPIRDSLHGGMALETSKPSNSWAVSFGMPSPEPRVWRKDVERAREGLPSHKILSVSVVGKGPADFARCASWAVGAGADVVEANISCPNVEPKLGALYLRPREAADTMRAIKDQIGDVPLLVKIGPLPDEQVAEALVWELGHFVTFVTTNCASTPVLGLSGLLFEGQKRGIGGKILRDLSLSQTKLLVDFGASVIGVGGISESADVFAYLGAGAGAVQIASAVLKNPNACLEIRRYINNLRSVATS